MVSLLQKRYINLSDLEYTVYQKLEDGAIIVDGRDDLINLVRKHGGKKLILLPQEKYIVEEVLSLIGMVTFGLAKINGKGYQTARLTELGKDVLETERMLRTWIGRLKRSFYKLIAD